MRVASIGLTLALCVACSDGASTSSAPDGSVPVNPDGGGSDSSPGPDSGKPPLDSGGPSVGIAAKYPGDLGIDKDPAVVWVENFEEGSVGAVTGRYDDSKNAAGMTLVSDIAPKSGGKASMKMTASGDGANATDLYKRLDPGYEDWYVRWYAKYQPSIQWHHSGVWFGGYNPATSYPSPQAGLKPNGDDRITVAIEPIYGVGSGAARFDFYNYWMNMHSWMAVPSGSQAYYGNGLVHQNTFTVDETKWSCLEVHVKLNPDPTNATGGMLEVWKNNTLVASFDDAGPKGYWIRDKFCPPGANGKECTDYPAPFDTVMDLQWRSTTSLKLNYFWPQNYITQAGVTGEVQYDDMVVATSRVGCIQ